MAVSDAGLHMQTDLTLRLPRQDEEEEFLRAHRATSPEVPGFLHYYKEGMPFSRYLELLADQERGVNLPPNHVASTFLFAFVATRIVGRVSIRHSLNEFLWQVRSSMFPRRLDGGLRAVGQNDKLRRPAVVMSAEAYDVDLSHSGRE
jgi:hypothetical protein